MDNPNAAPSSRLCIKNIPKYALENRLREHFSQKGEVTDVKVMKTRDGQSRQMGFIGYKTVEEAARALKYFNRSFMDTCRLEVDFARKYGDTDLSRPWSKHSEGSSAHTKKQEALAVGSGNKVVDGHAAEVSAKGGAAGNGDELLDALNDKKKKAFKKGSEEEQDPRLAEFLALMAPRSKAKVWANDDGVRPDNVSSAQGAAGGAAKANGMMMDDDGDVSDDDEEYINFLKPASEKGAGVSDLGSDSEGEEGVALESNKDAKELLENNNISDLEYLKARVTSWDDDDDDDTFGKRSDQAGVSTSLPKTGGKKKASAGSGSGSDEDDDAQEDAGASEGGGEEKEAAEKAEKTTETKGPEQVDGRLGYGNNDAATIEEEIADTGRLFVRNLPYGATETELSELFAEETKKSKGIAYILFQMPEDAGRLLHILPAKKPPTLMASSRTGLAEDAPSAMDTDEGARNETFKGAREAQRKEDAGDRSVWNTLFMRADTVAEAVAAHYGVPKSELLDKSASDLAVRMALGEAHVISETKMALAEAGVDISKIEAAASASGKASQTKKVARSPTTLLVKNLSYSTTEEDLLELFARSGPMARLVLPPTRTMAIVEFLEPGDARSAFKALAYKKFQHVPLYLEWAPKDIFSTPTPVEAIHVKAKAPAASEKAVARAAVAAVAVARAAAASNDGDAQQATTSAAADDAEDDGDGDSTTIFVKNLAFATTDAGLKKHFDKVMSSVGGSLHSARVAWKKGRDGKLLSMGFGFVECDSESIAKATIKKLQGSTLDSHKIVLQLSSKKEGDAAAKEKEKVTTKDKAAKGASTSDSSPKLVVRNVAFEATRKDLVGLFSPFGSIKSIRLPKKFDGSHRGFAFVEFVTKQEAKNAMEGVGGTHLYGRRLVVEYAEEGEGLDDLRAKTAAKFNDKDAPRSKRVKH
eukprot:gene10822-16908_t